MLVLGVPKMLEAGAAEEVLPKDPNGFDVPGLSSRRKVSDLGGWSEDWTHVWKAMAVPRAPLIVLLSARRCPSELVGRLVVVQPKSSRKSRSSWMRLERHCGSCSSSRSSHRIPSMTVPRPWTDLPDRLNGMASEPEAGPSRPARQASIHSLLSLRPHSSLSTSLITSTAPRGLLTSSALNENDLSVRPVGVDLVQEDEEGLRRGVLEGLDAVKGLVLCIRASLLRRTRHDAQLKQCIRLVFLAVVFVQRLSMLLQRILPIGSFQTRPGKAESPFPSARRFISSVWPPSARLQFSPLSLHAETLWDSTSAYRPCTSFSVWDASSPSLPKSRWDGTRRGSCVERLRGDWR